MLYALICTDKPDSLQLRLDTRPDSADEARAIADRDPYAQAGLFADVQVRPWKWTVGKPDAS
jgi:uncharacterized protein YciI